MQTEAIFDNIAQRIQTELEKAEKTIYIAVAWFTNKTIFDVLQSKSKKGCLVYLMLSDDEINKNSEIGYRQLENNGSKVFFIGNGNSNLMHNKFCIIDFKIVITGSYNWSYKAEHNHENIVITYDDFALAEQFIKEFQAIRQLYYPNIDAPVKDYPIERILKLFEILKNYILLEDIEEISRIADKLQPYSTDSDVKEIINHIKASDYSTAITKIENYIQQNKQLVVWTDTEIAALNLEIKNLEIRINAYNNEKIELEKLLAEFHTRHTNELGAIILELLELKKLKYKSDKTLYEEAEQDEKQYREQIKEEKEKNIEKLSDEEKNELKQIYRKSSMLCHPDKFVNESIEVQKKAEEVFKDLNEANSKNDIKRVSEILDQLKNGYLSTHAKNIISDKEKLRATIRLLSKKAIFIQNEIIEIKQSETYQTISSIEDWTEYFTNMKVKLNVELDNLRTEILKV